MKKYRKIPVEIEAIQLTDKNIFQVYSMIFGKPDISRQIASDKWDVYEESVKKNGMYLKTPESGQGTQIASIGDFIVKGFSEELGEHFWPVKPDYFKKSYEEV